MLSLQIILSEKSLIIKLFSLKIVKLSLETSVMPTERKQAVIRPLLKKPSLDYQEFKNFRPVSNLTFLSKVIEKVVALQLIDYIDNNGLCEVFQSAYRAHHNTETALLRVYNDIAMSIDNQKSVVLVLLDLSAAFDTVDHSLLLARLSTRFGICDQALDWFRSYLSDRTQYVRIQDVSSDVHALPYGVPQGSVLGPLLYSKLAAPSVWNALPFELRSCNSLSSFKSKLKTWLFKIGYDVVV